MSQHIASRRRLGAAISLALAVSVPNVAQADSSVWTTGGPYTGGTVRALRVKGSSSPPTPAGAGRRPTRA